MRKQYIRLFLQKKFSNKPVNEMPERKCRVRHCFVHTGKFMSKIDDYVTISPAMLRLVTLLFEVTFIAHILSCFWFFVTTFDERGANNWWRNVGLKEQMSLPVGTKSVALRQFTFHRIYFRNMRQKKSWKKF